MSLEIILENKRDDYLIQVLEESISELQSLKTKKYLNENLNLIGKILVEEGLLDTLKNHAGKIGLGAAALGTAAYAGTNPDETHSMLDQAKETLDKGVDKVSNITNDIKDKFNDHGNPKAPEITPTKLSDDDYIKSLNGGHKFADKASAETYLKDHPKAFDINNKSVIKPAENVEPITKEVNMAANGTASGSNVKPVNVDMNKVKSNIFGSDSPFVNHNQVNKLNTNEAK